MEVCRAVGIAARFVSGYQEGDRVQPSRDLHAWVEVYLPDAGWRGYDPTLGLGVCDRHIPLAASAIPASAAAIDGSVISVKSGQNITSSMNAQISIEIGNEKSIENEGLGTSISYLL
ncbi:MAG: transglutaminase-like domain-containing protein [Xenococcus sp. MO_188.B8]|nr:transglutaminase-like domain-containing protein [Xenococcus sp. MO_188.B8]